MKGALGERLGAGKEAEVYAFGDDVVKLYPPGRGQDAVAREAATLALVAGLDLPAPRAIAVDRFDGRCGLVMSRVGGGSFADHLFGGRATVEAVVEASVRLHLHVHAQPGAGLTDQKARLVGDIAAAASLSPSRRGALLARLTALPSGDRLCHGDFHFHNLLGPVESGVIVDWLDASCGLPAADACRTHLLLLRRHPALAASYVAAYARASGVPMAAILDWLPVLAAARLAEGAEGETDFLMGLVEREPEPRG